VNNLKYANVGEHPCSLFALILNQTKYCSKSELLPAPARNIPFQRVKGREGSWEDPNLTMARKPDLL
jgi:hypothetical protein